jgi:3-hydroxyisobutyrate dehydrogenase
MRVGFIGLGSQGGPMARRIVEHGFPTTLWARRPATLEPFGDTPAVVAGSPAEVAAQSDLVGVCVVDDADVEDVVNGPEGVLAGIGVGAVVAVHSTVHPETCRRLARDAHERGAALIDAPVSGGGDVASQGRLLVMVGGDTDAVERSRPVLATYGDPLVHVGGVGAGQIAKILNNLVFAAHLAVATGAFEIGATLGVEPATLAPVLAHGSARSYGIELTSALGFTAAPVGAHAGPLLRKDVAIAVELAQAAGIDLGPLLEAADVALDVLDHPR